MLMNEDSPPLNNRAFDLANQRHIDDRYAGGPYTDHLQEVVNVLKDFGYDDEIWQSRGWLHDILEDTKTSINELMELFGPEVVWPVFAVSGFGRNRKERNADIKRKLEIYGLEAQILKIADRIANCDRGAKNEMYRKELPEFMAAVKLVPYEMKERLYRALQVTPNEVESTPKVATYTKDIFPPGWRQDDRYR